MPLSLYSFISFQLLFSSQKNIQHVKKLFLVILVLGIVYVLYSTIFLKQLFASYDIKESQDIIEYFSKLLSKVQKFN